MIASMPGENHDPVAVNVPSIVQVGAPRRTGKLTDDEQAGLVGTAEQVSLDVGYQQNG